ncbi:MAG: Fe-S cluster assembly protein SufD [Nitrosomonas sp.]|nr:Fe-S cluster assembly protein SufD [Nitrosomonas sp.]MBK7364904.1 Fe-S cluster assembly protein SufD [Nitrosomonas sp.]
MTLMTLPNNDYINSLVQRWGAYSVTENIAWLDQLRSDALHCVNRLRMPTSHMETWRFTDISPLTKLSFPEASLFPRDQYAQLARFFLSESENRLVFIDGHYVAELSHIDSSERIIQGNLSSLILSHNQLISSYLGKLAQFEDDLFTALNTAFMQDCACVILPRNVSVAKPIHLLFISTQSETTSYPRCLVVAETGSRASIIEDYIATNENVYVTHSVAEFFLADSASVDHYRIQCDSDQAFHIANHVVRLSKSSCYTGINITFGAQISRFNQRIELSGEGAECSIEGFTLISGHQLADTHTFIDHIKPQGKSRQVHKCIADASAHGVFNGAVMVRPHAQQTDSAQMSRGLLLTDKAHIDAKPQLEIFADNVKCSHGATVGQLNKEEIFYLRSRGISESVARNLLTYAFGGEIIDHIAVPSLKTRLEETVLLRTQFA